MMDDGSSGSSKNAGGSAPRRELDWQFCQVFGEPHFDEVTEVDIVSAIEFDSTGEYLAAGDRGGRVVIFQRVEVPKKRNYPSPPPHLWFMSLLFDRFGPWSFRHLVAFSFSSLTMLFVLVFV